MKLTLEQVYTSQLELVKSDLEKQHQEALSRLEENLSKAHKDEINRLECEWSARVEELQEEHADELNDSLLENSVGMVIFYIYLFDILCSMNFFCVLFLLYVCMYGCVVGFIYHLWFGFRMIKFVLFLHVSIYQCIYTCGKII